VAQQSVTNTTEMIIVNFVTLKAAAKWEQTLRGAFDQQTGL
jgi:hypothetical protein